jgi:hypothetical protein
VGCGEWLRVVDMNHRMNFDSILGFISSETHLTDTAKSPSPGTSQSQGHGSAE